MIKVGTSYRTASDRKVTIIGKKKIPDRRGYNYLGETESGVVAYYNSNGEHIFYPTLNLVVSKYSWLPIINYKGGMIMGQPQFTEASSIPAALVKAAIAYLKIENDDLNTLKLATTQEFEANA